MVPVLKMLLTMTAITVKPKIYVIRILANLRKKPNYYRYGLELKLTDMSSS